MNNPVTRVLMLASFGAYAFIYIPGVVLLSFDIKYPNSEWVSSLLLILAGLSAAMWVIVNRGLRRGLLFTAAVLLLSYLIEYLGVNTGRIFGPYQYTSVLSPLLFSVPLAIPFAWLSVVLAAWFVANALPHLTWPTQRGVLGDKERAHVSAPLQGMKPSLITHYSSLIPIALAGLLTMLLDLLIEPVAVYVSGYWRWQQSGLYYGIPAQNFIAWAGAGALIALVAARYLGELSPTFAFAFLPPLLYIMNALLFGVVALAHGYIITGLLALVALVLGGLTLRVIWQAPP
jgi:uncharacterized membrane protein